MATTAAVVVDGDVVRLNGPAAIRAMAHPARMQVVDELYAGPVERTATELAALCGLSPSAMSYHLRALEKVGILVRAPAREDGRERPWRGRGRTIRIDNSTAAAVAGDVLVGLAFDRTRTLYGAWTAYRRDHSADRPSIASVSNGLLWLTRSEAEALAAEVDAVVERVTAATRTRVDSPDADRYAWSWAVFPDVSAQGRSESVEPARTTAAARANGRTA